MEQHLRTPWLRTQLIDWLSTMADRDWQEANWSSADANDSAIDEVLDSFDDTRLLEQPEGRVGYILADSREVAAMNRQRAALDATLSPTSPSDAEMVRSDGWRTVIAAARAAHEAMTK
ncbi:hypothetical protein AB0I66_00485 [Streptomyces sp. NPDC050439]|uniref:SCO4402 family protein n=1 Tax=Streptomyces sp. NPDC050439 TaxID=3155517 RepID=UPI0034177D57